MCGVVGIASAEPVSYLLYDALLMLQHRGQDAAGIATSDVNGAFCFRKSPGLVREVFNAQDLGNLRGSIGIGHVRYPTSGSTSAAEAQPLYVNAPYGIVLAHNGNLTNATELRAALFEQARRHLNTTSDSEVLLNIFADELSRLSDCTLSTAAIFSAIRGLHKRIRGAYACVALVAGHGMVAFRDPNGIRPLVLGRRQRPTGHDRCDYMIASESAALDAAGFELLRDVAPGEAIHVTSQGTLLAEQTVENPRKHPCLFEFVYFARPDSFIDNISVYSARVNMGRTLGANIARRWQSLAIDVVIPIPETACDVALAIAQLLNLPYRQGFVKNRYVGRTFIMAGQQQRRQSVRRKLNAIRAEFRDKAVLLVDDSIVRGTTSRQIVSMAREAGARKVYFASAAPMVQFPNVYGIDTPRMSELVAHGRDPESIRHIIGADALIFQELTDLIAAVREGNTEIQGFETSLFDGTYITGDIDAAYLSRLDQRCQPAGNTQKT